MYGKPVRGVPASARALACALTSADWEAWALDEGGPTAAQRRQAFPIGGEHGDRAGRVEGGGAEHGVDVVPVLSHVALPFTVQDFADGDGRPCRVARLPG